ncbi:head-tail connector protein [Thiosulfatihalobacter marinus]|uniref:head-tail connector protein n=1 Tax=Thiosulfatihalobacter marinus TaxID=2792481 RepID=UPI0018D7CAC8|nr:hypothetical protein [Thiosulfatihalobacter marinus]
MWLERISGGGDDLIDLAAAKAHLRLLGDDFDSEVSAAIKVASAHLDVDADGFGGLGFPLVDQQWSVKAAAFTSQVLRLPFARVTAVDEIRYTDPDGTAQVVPSSDYLLTRRGRDCVVVLLSGKVWPALIDRPDAVDIRFSAGFADVDSLPRDIVEAAKQLTAFHFENRDGAVDESAREGISICVDRLTLRYRKFAV